MKRCQKVSSGFVQNAGVVVGQVVITGKSFLAPLFFLPLGGNILLTSFLIFAFFYLQVFYTQGMLQI